MTESLSYLNQYLDAAFSHGAAWVYIVIFIACFIENVFPPFPGDSFIVVGGALVGAGRLDLIPTAVAIVAGGMSSVMLLYFLGRNYGREYFLKKNFKYFSADDVLAMEQKLQRWGVLILISSRFIVGVRSGIAVAAGIGRYPAAGMALFSGISYGVFVSLWLFVGIKIVNNLGLIEYYWETYNLIIWPIITLVVLLWLVRRYQKAKGKS